MNKVTEDCQEIGLLAALLCIGRLWYGLGFLEDGASVEVWEGDGE